MDERCAVKGGPTSGGWRPSPGVHPFARPGIQLGTGPGWICFSISAVFLLDGKRNPPIIVPAIRSQFPPGIQPGANSWCTDKPPSERRERTVSFLNRVIEALNFAKEVSSVTPAKAVFGSVGLLIMIKVRSSPHGNDLLIHASTGLDGQRTRPC